MCDKLRNNTLIWKKIRNEIYQKPEKNVKNGTHQTFIFCYDESPSFYGYLPPLKLGEKSDMLGLRIEPTGL